MLPETIIHNQMKFKNTIGNKEKGKEKNANLFKSTWTSRSTSNCNHSIQYTSKESKLFSGEIMKHIHDK